MMPRDILLTAGSFFLNFKVYQEVAQQAPANSDIGVFLCGPKVLSVELHEIPR